MAPKIIRSSIAVFTLLFLLSGTRAVAQSSPQTGTTGNSAPDETAEFGSTYKPANSSQPARILGIMPNYRSVTADTKLPPLSVRQKFHLATEDSFDYSSLILAGFIGGVGDVMHTNPEFHTGAAGYGRYVWHSYVDETIGNYMTEAIIPAIAHEDPRYYTLGHGSFLHRTGYAISRLVVTRSDSGQSRFNFSEIAGNGIGAGLSNLYYPQEERGWNKTRQKWVTQISLDAVFNVFKEYWPDISQRLTRQH